MRVLVRKTISGDEYWDTVEKRTILVRTGQQPNFEYEVDPETMLVGGVDMASGNDMTVMTVDYEKMTVKQLHEHAAELSIEIPDDVKKKNDLIAFLKSRQ